VTCPSPWTTGTATDHERSVGRPIYVMLGLTAYAKRDTVGATGQRAR
jgi:hypothetical protein